jgi:hypothetical protein
VLFRIQGPCGGRALENDAALGDGSIL